MAAAAAPPPAVAAAENPLLEFSDAVGAAVVYPNVDASLPVVVGSLWSAWAGSSLYGYSSPSRSPWVSVIAAPRGAGKSVRLQGTAWAAYPGRLKPKVLHPGAHRPRCAVLWTAESSRQRVDLPKRRSTSAQPATRQVRYGPGAGSLVTALLRPGYRQRRFDCRRWQLQQRLFFFWARPFPATPIGVVSAPSPESPRLALFRSAQFSFSYAFVLFPLPRPHFPSLLSRRKLALFFFGDASYRCDSVPSSLMGRVGGCGGRPFVGCGRGCATNRFFVVLKYPREQRTKWRGKFHLRESRNCHPFGISVSRPVGVQLDAFQHGG